jgi:hypothetical protein
VNVRATPGSGEDVAVDAHRSVAVGSTRSAATTRASGTPARALASRTAAADSAKKVHKQVSSSMT